VILSVARKIALFGCLPFCAGHAESVREQLTKGGAILLHKELQITAQDHDWNIDAHSATIQLAPDFQGRAAIVISGGRNIRIQGLTIDGGHDRVAHAVQETAPANVTLAASARDNGILVEKSSGIHLENVALTNIAGLSILVSASDHIQITGAKITASGSRNARHRNNATGGILLEEGTHDFDVSNCEIRDVLGNGIWTRSLLKSPSNADGRITNNRISGIARAAIQIGSATRVLVEKNTGAKIGYPLDAVDRDAGATPAAIDTAGDTGASQYRENAFEEVNGTCIGLDGFHDGEVRGNSCVNTYDREAYPDSQFGMIMNNSNPRVESRNILIWGNRLEGFLYGGILVIGSGHRISHNHFLHLNLAHCNEEGGQARCRFPAGEPDLLRSGIYIRNKAERNADARDNSLEDNEISGFGMGARCVVLGPGVNPAQNRIGRNDCTDDTPVSAGLQLVGPMPASGVRLPLTREMAFTSLRTGGSLKSGNTSNSPSHQVE
jgi:hypothetical protein